MCVAKQSLPLAFVFFLGCSVSDLCVQENDEDFSLFKFAVCSNLNGTTLLALPFILLLNIARCDHCYVAGQSCCYKIQ